MKRSLILDKNRRNPSFDVIKKSKSYLQVPQPLWKPLIFKGFFVSQSSSKSPVNQFSYYFLTIFLIFRNEKIKSLIKISSFSLSGIREKWEKRESKNPCPAAFLILRFLLWNGNFTLHQQNNLSLFPLHKYRRRCQYFYRDKGSCP